MSFLLGPIPAKVPDWMKIRYKPRPEYQSPTATPTPLIEQLDPSRSLSSPATIHQPSNSNHFSDRLKVFVGTWNMYGRLMPFDLSTFLTENNIQHNDTGNNTMESLWLDGSTVHPYHLLVIGTQECEKVIHEALFNPSKEVWEKQLSEFLGSDYKLVKTETLAALHIAVFVWVPVASLVREVQSESIKTGWGNMIGNKGAVAVSVLFGTRSLLFINCHLTAHQSKLSERNANVQRILYDLKMPNFIKSGQNKKKSYKSVIDQFDHVFLFGDTNYRVTADRSFVFDALRQEDYNTLLEYDQLSMERRMEESPLNHFREHPIQFPPTYKFDTIPFNNDAVDTSELELDESSSTALNHPESLLSVTNSSISNGLSRFTSKQSLRSTSKQAATNIKRKISKKFIPSLSSNNNNTAAVVEEKDEKDSSNRIVFTPTKLKSSNLSSPSSSYFRSSTSSSSSSSSSLLTSSLARSLSSPSTELSPSLITIPPPSSPLSSSSTTTIIPLTIPSSDKIDNQITINEIILTYDSSEKQRIPSWTDRILWCDRSALHHIAPPPTLINKKKSITSSKKPKLKAQRPNLLFPFRSKRHILRDTICYSYNSVLDQSLVGVSDHLPVIGVFGIWYDEWHLVHMDHEPLLDHRCKKLQWWQKIFCRSHCPYCK